jgi:hypothetical protein
MTLQSMCLDTGGNPYRPEKEYFWFRADDKPTAKQWAARKQERGQPRNFTNWVKGTSKYFTSIDKFLQACKAVNLNLK